MMVEFSMVEFSVVEFTYGGIFRGGIFLGGIFRGGIYLEPLNQKSFFQPDPIITQQVVQALIFETQFL